jgi:hypothetical protein
VQRHEHFDMLTRSLVTNLGSGQVDNDDIITIKPRYILQEGRHALPHAEQHT